MKRITSAAVLLAALGAVVAPLPAAAQAWPAKPVRTIMTVAGGADVIARLVAEHLTRALGQPVIVDAQPGAGGAIGAQTVMRAAPDGYTIMLSAAANIVMRGFLTKNTPYDPIRSFTPIGKVADTILVVIANPKAPFNDMKEMVAYAKRNPGKLSYGTSGVGTSHHLSAEIIHELTGIEWVHIPYKGGPPVLTAVVSDPTQVGFSILATSMPMVKAGKVKILAVNNNERYPLLPQVPTVGEQIPGYERPPGWMAYFGPAGMPAPIVQRLNTEIVKVMNLPEVKSKAEAIGFVSSTSTPDELGAMIRKDLVAIAKIVKAAGIKPE
jgi:tripartite-type tricarboxylate transporter receptor subunit TctC